MDIPLHLIHGEDAERIIIAWPIGHEFPQRHALEKNKREITVHHTRRNQPRNDDIKTWIKADHKWHWMAYREDELREFPRIGIVIGPLQANGKFFTQDKIENPISADIKGDYYSRKQFDHECEVWNDALKQVRRDFIAGQIGTGPYLDAVVFLKVERMILGALEQCKKRFQRRLGKKKQELEHGQWINIGNDQALAMRFKQDGWTIRRIECAKPYYEVKQV